MIKTMEQQSAVELCKELNIRLRALNEMIDHPPDARGKEKRQFETQAFPLSSITELFQSIDAPYYLRESKIGQPIVDELITLFTRSLELCDYQLKVKPSRKVRHPKTRRVLFEHLQLRIREVEWAGRMGTLSDLYIANDRGWVHSAATAGAAKDSAHLTDLMSLLTQRELWTETNVMHFHKKWPKETRADLRVKFYPNRADLRAFVSDKSEFRSLLGSIIHALLQPSRAERGKFEPYSSCYPSKDKHIITMDVTIKEDQRMSILFGDISSFTSSFKNIWVTLIGCTLELERRKCDITVIIDVGGSLLECKLTHVLRLYLYEATVVLVRDENQPFCSVGGMLGIAGVDTLAKIIFSLFLRVLCARSHGIIRAWPRLGGDDFIIWILSTEKQAHRKVEAIDYFRREISRYIGKLKELIEEPIPKHWADYITEPAYCKKKLRVLVILTQNGQRVQIQSQFKIPMFAALINPQCTTTTRSEFWIGTRSAPWVPQHWQIRSMLYSLFTTDSAEPLSLWRKGLSLPLDCENVDGYSGGAIRVLSLVPTIRDSQGNHYRVSLKSKLSSVRFDRLAVVKYLENGLYKSMVCTRQEADKRVFSVYTDVQPLHIGVLLETRQLIQKVRLSLSNYDVEYSF